MAWSTLLVFAGMATAELGRAPSPDDGEPDGVLLRRMAARDGEALAALYDRFCRRVFSLAFRILGTQADAEDITQEVFAQAWRQADRYDAARGAPGAWLLNMTRSRAIDRLRADRVRVATEPLERSATEPPAHGDPGPEEQAIAFREAERIRSALTMLPPLQRTAIELAFFEGLSHTQIAERLEQPLGTIKTRIRLGLLRLRDVMSSAT